MRLPPLATALHFAGVIGRHMFGRQEESEPMNWAEVLAEKTLRDLPCEIELERYGNIVRDPVSVQFGRRDARVALYMDQRSQSVFHVDPRSELNK